MEKAHECSPGLEAPSPEAVFNHCLLAFAVRAVFETNLRDRLVEGVALESIRDSKQRAVLAALLQILHDHRIVDESHGLYRLTVSAHAMQRDFGYFTWLLGGYPDYLVKLGDVASGRAATVCSNGGMVALGSAAVDRNHLRAEIQEIICSLNPTCVADLGCGDGTRLRQLLLDCPLIHGVGVERNNSAFRLACDNLGELTNAGRALVVEADCQQPLDSHCFLTKVDTVVVLFLLHDLLEARDGDLNVVLTQMRKTFPTARHVIFADTTCDPPPVAAPTPIFSRAFELVHAMMGVTLRTLDEYTALFHESTGTLIRTHALKVPNSYVFVVTL